MQPSRPSHGRPAGPVPDESTGELLAAGASASWTHGDAEDSRRWLDAAYAAAEQSRDGEAMALAALDLAGLWVHQHRAPAAAVILRDRLQRALASVDPSSSLGRRLRARLAAESDYLAGEAAAILAAVDEARQSGNVLATAEAVHLAQQCLMSPDRGSLRSDLADELIALGSRTGRRLDLLLGVMWHTVNLVLAGHRHAQRGLTELRGMLIVDEHAAVGHVVRAIDVMLDIRAGSFDRAEQQAKECAERGDSIGDANASAWYAAQLTAIRWFQGRLGELVPLLGDLVASPSLSTVDNSGHAALALAAASAGDRRLAASTLARLGTLDLGEAPRSSNWLVTMYGAVEAAHLLHDEGTASRAYELLLPFASLPAIMSPGVVCFGSVQHALGVAALTTGDHRGAAEHLRLAVRDNIALGHWPAAALARYRLATALSRLAGGVADPAARAELDAARCDAAEFGMVLPGEPAAPARTPAAREVGLLAPRFEHLGRYWHIHTRQRSTVVQDCRGMTYLAILVANPGQEIAAVELVAGPGSPATGAAARAAGQVQQPVLDRRAIDDYRQRLATLQKEIDRYDTIGDQDGAIRAHAEREWLLSELRSATGLAGRTRPFATVDERARVAVGKAIRRALERIHRADPDLGEALARSVRTGLRCCYGPGPVVPVTW